MRVLWLADVLRAVGLTVVEHPGWRTRGWEPWEPRYGIVHATAAPRTQSDQRQVEIVRDGHSTLPGPIANACVDRAGRWHVLASGRCNTALVGWAGPAKGLGNDRVLGVEACNDNVSEPWPTAQLDAYERGWAAVCRRMGWPASRVVGHKEHQPGDKSDPLFNMDTFRRRVAELIEEDDMPSADEIARAVEARIMGRTLRKIRPDTSDTMSYEGMTRWTHGHVVDSKAMVRELVAGQAAILARLDGADDGATRRAIRDELDRHRAELLAELGEDLADRVADRLTEVPAEQVRAAVRAELAALRLVPEPAVD